MICTKVDKNSINSCSSSEIINDIFDDKRKDCFLRKIEISQFTSLGVLIVDDDQYNIQVLKAMLTSMNYKTDWARNGQEAIEKIEYNLKDNKIFEVILMDYNMPVMNGVEATLILNDKIQKNLIPFIEIIGITAYIDEESIKKCIDAGMKIVLTKPVSKAKLEAIMKEYNFDF